MNLLSRDEFRKAVFERDRNKCVICGKLAQDAHHIMERRLFENGGYYINNGASLCGKHHILAETTELSCEEIREKARINEIVLPPHLYKENIYDKWGNIILTNKQRLKGELFYDESVQRIIKPVLHLFTEYVKYPRTYHCPWSQGITNDDRVLKNMDSFIGKEIIVTEKMDGENTTIYSDYLHARSVDAQSHWTQSFVRQLQNKIGYNIPKGWRICGENLYARHSISYDSLDSFFLMFSIWNDRNECLSWQDTIEWANLLGLDLVPVIYKGIYNENIIRNCYKNGSEGYVIRLADKFNYSQFKYSVAKFVRKNHVTTSNHWKFEKIEKNKLKT
jgi:RNA ligase